MFCIKCGKQIPDEAKFCPECGFNFGTLTEEKKEEPKVEIPKTVAPPQPIVLPRYVERPKPKKRRGCLKFFLTIILIAVIGFAGFTYFVVKEGTKPSKITESHKTTVSDIVEEKKKASTPKPTATPVAEEIEEDDEIPSEASAEEVTPEPTEEPTPEPTEEPSPEPTEVPVEERSGISPEFKEAMDAYEEFFDEYIEFMNSFSEDSADFNMILEYSDFLGKYTKTMKELDDIADDDLTTEEYAYYIEVLGRINTKLYEAALNME
ncbi:MAG: zinc-ribbon domain-containing protein [Clostridia bacterium]|nr:zinc-ribbon domain-containing protein [Clostridia bacterium]